MLHVRSRRRRGFTLIELLVVIAIIAILVGLMMPAVQKAREAANRISCTNNLHQLTLAVHHYENDHGAFPPSRTNNYSTTWAVLLLPYIEQLNLYAKWDLSLSYYQQPLIAQRTGVPIFFCPTRRVPEMGLSISGDQPATAGGLGPNVPGALGDYAANNGTTGNDDPASGTRPNGTFEVRTRDRGVRFAEIMDGTSNTLLIGEKHVPIDKFGVGWMDNSLYNGDSYVSSTRSAGPSYPLAQLPQQQTWAFGSYHLSLCQFGFADGSVRTVSSSIDPVTLGWLAQRNDGQVVTGDF
jgi:prepilin-type N-terminal cleavage/methylation domain-containing protein